MVLHERVDGGEGGRSWEAGGGGAVFGLGWGWVAGVGLREGLQGWGCVGWGGAGGGGR